MLTRPRSRHCPRRTGGNDTLGIARTPAIFPGAGGGLHAHDARKAEVRFSAEAQQRDSYAFDIPFSRQQLADYLGAEHSRLSIEPGKMRGKGLLAFHKSRLLLKALDVGACFPTVR